MSGAERDPLTGLPPRAAGPLHDIPVEKPLHPRNISRQTVFCQASIRRFIHTRKVMRGVTGLRKPREPAIATSLYFCKHLRFPDFIDVEEEAICVAALICSRETAKGLKLGDVSDAYLEYAPHLRGTHPALCMLLERFDDIVVEAEEDALNRMQEVSLPSDAEAKLRETMLAWRCPEERPGGGMLFKLPKELIDKLRLEHEQVLIARMPIVNNQEAYGAVMAEVEREFVATRTILRAQVRGGRNRHRALIETELQTMYGWPPTGPGPSLKRAARQYVLELGTEHPLTEDFVAAARRHVKSKEERCIQDLSGLEVEILKFRGLVNADPSPPKLLWESYRDELNANCLEAMQKLEHWRQDLGEDSPAYLRFLKSTLGSAEFLDHCEARVQETADDMRRLGPRPAPSLEENHVTEARAIEATKLAHFLEALEAHGRTGKVAAMRREFAFELKRVEEAVAIFKDQEEEVGEGWHRPPGFEGVEQPDAPPPKPPTPPPPKQFRLERELPGMREGDSLQMRLHGVGWEDVKRHNEILLLEMCADIIAEECGIPRDCIINMKFSDSAPKGGAAPVDSPVSPTLGEAPVDVTARGEIASDGYAATQNPIAQ